MGTHFTTHRNPVDLFKVSAGGRKRQKIGQNFHEEVFKSFSSWYFNKFFKTVDVEKRLVKVITCSEILLENFVHYEIHYLINVDIAK